MSTLARAIAVCFLLVTSSAARADLILLNGALNAAQVVDGGGSTSTATGFAALAIDTVAETLTLDFSWTGLTGLADRAHLHDAPAGVSRTVDPFDRFFDEVFYSDNPLRSIPCGGDWAFYDMCVPASGTLHFMQSLATVLDLSSSCDPTFSVCSIAEFVTMALNDIIYLDMHTELFPSGEIRGQLQPVTTVPEPAAALLLAWGLLLAAWFRRAPRRVHRR